LARLHQHLGQPAQAVTCFGRALEILRKLGDRHSETRTLIHLGDTSYAAGDLPAARRAWQAALAILDELSHPDGDELWSKIVAAGQSPSLPRTAVKAP
jgi:tetratricopeptide (TPR) repeat protein